MWVDNTICYLQIAFEISIEILQWNEWIKIDGAENN